MAETLMTCVGRDVSNLAVAELHRRGGKPYNRDIHPDGLAGFIGLERVRTALYNLERNGFADRDNGAFTLTAAGKEYCVPASLYAMRASASSGYSMGDVLGSSGGFSSFSATSRRVRIITQDFTEPLSMPDLITAAGDPNRRGVRETAATSDMVVALTSSGHLSPAGFRRIGSRSERVYQLTDKGGVARDVITTVGSIAEGRPTDGVRAVMDRYADVSELKRDAEILRPLI